jgi:GR25 family glycosyltransferase involved in LPS biosynthesis
MNILNEYFDKIYCINLDRRPDRWYESVKIFEANGLEVERFPACDGQLIDTGYGKVYNGELGGTISHTRIIKKILDSGVKNALILEDDIEFNENFFEKTRESLEELPENWDMLFFGGNHTGGYDKVTKNLVRVYRTYALHCYAVNRKALEVIYDNMIRFIGHTLSCNRQLTPSVAADYYMAKTHPLLNVYSIHPNITWQRESFSDLQQDVMIYDFLKNEG